MQMIDFDDITPNSARDVLNAVPDALGMALGAHAIRNPHPFAEMVAPSPLRVAAFAAGQLLAASRPGEAQAAVIGRGLRTQQFGNAIASGVEAAARRRFDAQARHAAAVSVVEVTRLGEPEPVGALDLSVPFENVSDGIEYKTANGALQDGESIVLSSLGRLVGITREAVFNDDLNLIEDAISATGVAAARLEARLVAAALEGTGNLTDGSPAFDAAFGNVSAAAFDAAGLAAAMAALRTMAAADGEALDAAAVSLIVAAGLEYSARQLVHQAGIPVEVYVLPGLAAGRYYLSASPDVARSIALARLEGQSHPLSVEAVRTPIAYDGSIVRVRIDTGAAMVGRLGIVRGGT